MPFLPWARVLGNTIVPAASVSGHPANPATTASTTLVMAGLAQTITPLSTGKVQVIVTGVAFTSTAAVSLTVGGRYGTGTAPVQGAAVTGTRFGGAADQVIQASGLTAGDGFALADVVTGLTIGTAVWFDLAYATSAAADVANLNSIGVALVELVN